MSINKNLRFFVISGIIIAVITIITAGVILSFNRPVYTFYYPDKELKSLKTEKRYIEPGKKTVISKEELIIREYLLGPIHYDLKLPADDKVLLKNFWFIDNPKRIAAVISFNGDFDQFVRAKNDAAWWLLNGLIETVKANTRIEKIYILVDDKPYRKKVGGWNLGYAVLVRTKK